MFCGQCGAPTTPNAAFCKDCGAPVRSAPVATLPLPQPAPPRRPRRRLAATFVITSGVLAALVAGWAVHLIAFGPSEAHAVGAPKAAEAVDAQDGESEGADSPSDSPSPGSADAMTSFLTACGELLDIVPTAAVSTETAVQVTLEVRPVCPEGERIESSQFRVVLRGSGETVGEVPAGTVIADGTFDLSSDALLVPGFGDPGSELVASFGVGTAWLAPDSLASDIADGVVVVECEAVDGAPSTPVSEGEVLEASTTSVDAGVSEAADDSLTALAALQRQAALDDPSVSALEGAWVAQLSSKAEGTYDDHDGKTYTLADVYQQFLSLRLIYPNVLLLNSSDWKSYTLGGYWVVIAGVPYSKPGEPNRWCTDRGIAPSQCFAKKLVRDGAPTGTTKHR
jgi:hypothetical protein